MPFNTPIGAGWPSSFCFTAMAIVQVLLVE